MHMATDPLKNDTDKLTLTMTREQVRELHILVEGSIAEELEYHSPRYLKLKAIASVLSMAHNHAAGQPKR